jgi:hypothetical protein
MKMVRRNKRSLLLFLILFPTVLMLSTFIAKTQAGPYVPESNPNNRWHWEVDAGDQLYFEGEFILTNASTGEVYMMWRDIWIYNITAISNVTLNWLGLNQFSQINATQCYYNVSSGEIESYGYESEIALFGYNHTDATQLRIRAGQGGVPYILPINGSRGLEVDVLDDVINETFYYPMGQGGFNRFDNFISNPGLNRIYFWNSTHDFFADSYYYNDGTLDTATAYLMVEMGNGPVLINATMTQVFDYNITDEVQWGVNVGDTFTYDWYEGSSSIDDAYEIMVNITDISPVLLEKNKNSFNEQEPIYMVYESVFADLFLWNGTEYEQVEWDIPVGTANNFYPQYFDEGGPSQFNFVYPNNFALEDFEFMWNNDTLRIWGAPFDEIYYSENGVLESTIMNSTGKSYVHNIVDKATGIVQYNLMYDPSYILLYELKSQTQVDWSLGVGDTVFYKENADVFTDIKAKIIGTFTVYANMSEVLGDVGVTVPSGQPELQFFSYLLAEFSEWDPSTQSWVYEDTIPMAIANIFWPISPISFQFGPPLLMPEGTTSSDLSAIFDFFSYAYDIITYNSGYILLRNSTLDRELNFYFDETSGQVKMMYGWTNMGGPGSDWSYMSIYPKFSHALNPGPNSFTLSSDFPSGITITVDVEIGPTGTGAALIYNYFPMNPVNVSLPNGTAIAYFDQLFTNYTLISSNVTMTITLPTSIDVSTMVVFFYAFNMSGMNDWSEAPPDFYANYVTINAGTNSIIIKMEPFMFNKGIISAMAYMTGEEGEEEIIEEIPGYNLYLISFLIIIASALLIRKIRKKR